MAPRSISRRPRGPNHNTIVKQDPDAAGVPSPSPSDSGNVNFGIDASPTNNNFTSTNSNFGDSSAQVPVNRNGRSDAPPPSERTTEPEPLLRELRMKPPRTVPVESPASPDESFFNTSFHASFQDIGKKLKACNDTLGELQQLGVSHDVQLPELVLVGDQSAGKSSLMSGLANLDLPRSEGTCTRCPLHIRVSRNSDWSCRVWLRKEYSYQPPEDRDISENDVTDQDPFFPWRKLPATAVHEFKSMHDKSEIEEVLRWAQIAILNDDKSHKLFVPGAGSIAINTPIAKAADETTAKFSPNVVALEIKGPNLPDLSFYDMPGIFQNPADARDDYLVNVVRNLSKDYIRHPSAIILCSMPMNSDAENSSTFGLTRKLGASSRTIGVLTKADLIPEAGNHDQWLSIMKGETHHTGFGYFITSRPQGKDLEDLKHWEEGLFLNGSFENWPAAFHQFKDKCGVETLKSFLSERLGAEFSKSLPTIKQKAQHHLEKITNQLNKLPELPSNVECEVQTSLIEFMEQARARLKATDKLSNLPDSFRHCLLEMKPKFILKDQEDIPIYEISDDESDAGSTTTATVTPSKRRNQPVPMTPAKRQRTLDASAAANGGSFNGGSFNGGSVNGGSFNGNSFSGRVKPEEGRESAAPGLQPPKRATLPEPFARFSEVGRHFRTLRQVREEIISKMHIGMPDLIPEEVYVDLCREAVKPWDGPMKVFLTHVTKLLHEMLESALKKAFERLNKRLIYQESKKHIKFYLDERRKSTEDAITILYRLETQALFTINHEAFSRCRKDEEGLLKRYRHFMRMQARSPGPQKQPPPWVTLNEEKRAQEEKRREAELGKIGPDPFHREVDVMVYVRGYYRLAALRFADSVALYVINGMIPEIERHLPYYLDTKLGLRGPDSASVYERLMAEDEATAAKRETLKIEKEKFVKALTSIEGLEASARSSSLLHRDDSTDVTMSGAQDVDEET